MADNAHGSVGAAARAGIGGLAGALATFVMDAVTDVFYTAHIKERESAISSRSAGAAVATQMLTALGLEPNEEDAGKAASVLHWTIGIGSGMIAGVLSGKRARGAIAACAISTAGMLCFDEFGLSAIGAMPPSSRYPWQTNFRSVVGHLAFGTILTLAYSVAALVVEGTCRD
ncbi:MAG: hypothetical protein M3T49_04505 [Candidatus Eremiobacteraeota bacterium]|nr:hypothetical protein [Candidatus Eremiobacteraeota bacterium]